MATFASLWDSPRVLCASKKWGNHLLGLAETPAACLQHLAQCLESEGCRPRSWTKIRRAELFESRVASSFFLLVVWPGATSSFLLLVAMSFVPSSFLLLVAMPLLLVAIHLVTNSCLFHMTLVPVCCSLGRLGSAWMGDMDAILPSFSDALRLWRGVKNRFFGSWDRANVGVGSSSTGSFGVKLSRFSLRPPG